MTDVIATTTSGKVRGTTVGGVCRFYGVPYAAGPVGQLRFLAPVPHAPWSGERDATAKAPNAPQISRNFPNIDLSPIIGPGWRKGDDYLVANIWTPDIHAKGLPVMMFIHGGAWIAGGGDAAAYDGASFARNGIVCITINYRLGVEGMLPLAGGATNLFLRDQIAALKWVRQNAEAFGGDPANVTVFGELAGGSSIASLLGSRPAKGLFRRAIVQSGHGTMWRTQLTSNVLIAKLAETLGIEPSAGGFRSKSIDEAMKAEEVVMQPGYRLDLREANGRDPTYGVAKFLPLMGDEMIPRPSVSALLDGEGADVDLLIGTTTEEMNLYFVPTGVIDIADPALVTSMLDAVAPHAPAILEDYGLGKAKPGVALTNALCDLLFRDPARQFALAHRGRTHFYEFGWRSPAMGGRLGACHALELPFVFNTLSSCTGKSGFAGEKPPQELADHTHKIWARFATDGTVPWPEFDANTRQVYRLDKASASREEEMPAAKYRV